MPLNSSGKLSLGGDVVGESVNLELEVAAGAANSMVSDANKQLTGKATGPWVFPDDWRGKTNVKLIFDNTNAFDVRQIGGFAFIGFSQTGGITKTGSAKAQGPDNYLFPIGSSGSYYEIRLIVDAVSTPGFISSLSFAGVAVTAPGTTSYYSLGGPIPMSVLSDVPAYASGTVEIRRAGFGTPMINRAFYIAVVYPTYAWGSYPTSIDEGLSNYGRFYVNTTNVPDGTQLKYRTVGITANSADSPYIGRTNQFGISSNAGDFSIGADAHNLTEGAETFYVEVTNFDETVVLLTSNTVTINDTSRAAPVYSLSHAGSVNEGSSVTFTISGSNIPNGTYYWSVSSSGDFSTSSGSFSITSNSGSFSASPTADLTTEGAETFTATVTNSSGAVVASSGSVTINDTSITPVTTAAVAAPSLS